MNPGGED